MSGGTLRHDTVHVSVCPSQTSVTSGTSRTFEELEALRQRLLETAAEVIADGGYPRLGRTADQLFLA